MSDFRWPDNSKRVLIAGSTGSGKSHMMAHFLSNAPFDYQPYIVLDYKDEDLINEIELARDLSLKDGVPKEPGIYILKCRPDLDDEAVNAFLYKVLAKGKTGLVYDEGYMVPNLGAMNAVYTQGRTKRIPVITLTQRPVHLSRFAFSESDFFVQMRFNDDRDCQTFQSFVPREGVWDFRKSIPEYHARWYDVAKNTSAVLLPAPSADAILNKFDERLRTRIRMI